MPHGHRLTDASARPCRRPGFSAGRSSAHSCGYADVVEEDSGARNEARAVDPRAVASARVRVPSPEDCDRLGAVLSLIAGPTRIRLLYALDTAEELCVGDLALVLSASEDSVGYGLRVLRTAGLVTRRKEGRTVYYRLTDGFPELLRSDCLRQLVHLSRTTAYGGA